MVTTESYSPHEAPYVLVPEFPRPERGLLFSPSVTRSTNHERWILGRWWETVYEYSKCSLTKQSDKLIALGGIAKLFSTVMPEPYYVGLWGGQHFVRSLLWERRYIYEAPNYRRVEEYRGLCSLLLLQFILHSRPSVLLLATRTPQHHLGRGRQLTDQ